MNKEEVIDALPVNNESVYIAIDRNTLIATISEAMNKCMDTYCSACKYEESVCECRALFITDYIRDNLVVTKGVTYEI